MLNIAHFILLVFPSPSIFGWSQVILMIDVHVNCYKCIFNTRIKYGTNHVLFTSSYTANSYKTYFVLFLKVSSKLWTILFGARGITDNSSWCMMTVKITLNGISFDTNNKWMIFAVFDYNYQCLRHTPAGWFFV